MSSLFTNIVIGGVISYAVVMYLRNSGTNFPGVLTSGTTGSTLFKNSENTINTKMSQLSNDCMLGPGGACDTLYSEYKGYNIYYGQQF
jgi:hypothetical protein